MFVENLDPDNDLFSMGLSVGERHSRVKAWCACGTCFTHMIYNYHKKGRKCPVCGNRTINLVKLTGDNELGYLHTLIQNLVRMDRKEKISY